MSDQETIVETEALEHANLASTDRAPGSPGTHDRYAGDPLDDPARIGRFVILRRLGEGGMGVVYSAFDEELDRRVAIKLVRSDRGGEGVQARMQREAQAMARLSHPNVVQVHEVGRHDGQVFVAMELVRGVSLRAWHKKPRPWREVLAVYLQAGAGLAAAHAAGMIHRDFKPDNAILGDDGRVRVLDFGLAGAADEIAAVGEVDGEDSSRPFDRLTQTGEVIGTPAYMAPEQFLGEPTSPRTDVFSFCVALYEALYGERPYHGGSRMELLANVSAGKRRPAPNGADVPRWLHDAVVAGVAPSADARPPDMHGLLETLARDPSRVRRRIAWGSSAFAALAVATWLGAASTRSASPCAGVAASMTELWSPARRDALERGLAGVDATFAGPTTAHVLRDIDAYARNWSTARTEACEATKIRAEQSDTRYDRAIACLDARHLALAALLDVLTDADADVVAKAPGAVEALPALAPCRDPRVLDAAVESPPPEIEPEVEALRERLEHARATIAVGRVVQGRSELEEILGRSRSLGHAPLLADVALELGTLRQSLEEPDPEIVDLLLEAASAAETAGALEPRAEALLYLAVTTYSILGRPHEAQRWALVAEAAIGRLGSAGIHLQVKLLAARARLAWEALEHERSRALLEEARALAVEHGTQASIEATSITRILGESVANAGDFERGRALVVEARDLLEAELGEDHPAVVTSIATLGQVLALEGRNEEALAELREASTRTQRSLGPTHPSHAMVLNRMARTLIAAGEPEEAMRVGEEAVRIAQQAHGRDHLEVARAWVDFGATTLAAGDVERTRHAADRARAIFEAIDPDHIERTTVHDLLGGLAFRSGDLDTAETHARAVVRTRKARYPGPHQDTAIALGNLAEVFEARGQLDRAEAAYRETLGMREAILGRDHPRVARDRFNLGRVLLANGRATEAVPSFEETARIHALRGAPPIAIAETLWGLAQGRLELGEREAALASAREARAAFEQAGQSDRLAEVDAWLARASG
jgi:eukaryotic-like serine/threonine-protein kinase